MTKKNIKNTELYLVQINNDTDPEYLKPVMLGTTKYLPDAGLFTKDELTHGKALRKDNAFYPVDALATIEQRIYTLKNQIDGLCYEKDLLECLKSNIENGNEKGNNT